MKELNTFLKEEVMIRTKKDFFYRGIIVSILDESIIFQDRYDGEMFLALSEILSISKIKDGR